MQIVLHQVLVCFFKQFSLRITHALVKVQFSHFALQIVNIALLVLQTLFLHFDNLFGLLKIQAGRVYLSFLPAFLFISAIFLIFVSGKIYFMCLCMFPLESLCFLKCIFFLLSETILSNLILGNFLLILFFIILQFQYFELLTIDNV